MQQQSSSSSSNRFIEHDVCWKTKNSVVECKASENVWKSLRCFRRVWNLLSAIGLEVRKSRAEVFKSLAAAEYPSHTSSGTARNRVPVLWSSCYNLCKALQDRAPRGSVGFWAPPRPLEERAHACARARSKCPPARARRVWKLAPHDQQLGASFFVQLLRARSTMTLTTKTARHGGVF